MKPVPSFSTLADRDLLEEVKRLARMEQDVTATLIGSLAEVDARRLYLGEGCSSLFTYCTQVLHLSEHAAYGRIEAARAGRRFPLVLERLATGSVTLTAVTLLGPHLREQNHRALLEGAHHKSKREVEAIVAALQPRSDVAPMVRKVAAPKPAVAISAGHVAASASDRETAESSDRGGSAGATPYTAASSGAPRASVAAPPPVVSQLSPERYKVQFTVGRATHDKLRRVQDLLRHAVPNGDPAQIFDRALTLLLADLEKTKLAKTNRPRPGRPGAAGSRHIPSAVRRIVWARDDARCAFIGSEGRCRETGFLEFHHVEPYARGGPATAVNIQLRCRAHNHYEGEQVFGSRCLEVREYAQSYGHPAANSVRTGLSFLLPQSQVEGKWHIRSA